MFFRKSSSFLARGIKGNFIAFKDRVKILIYKMMGLKYIIRDVLNFKLILDLDDKGLSLQLLKYNYREPDHKYILEKELKPGMKILDCGANIGYYSVMMAKLLDKKCTIFAIEPSKYNYHLLNLNLLLNKVDNVVHTYNMGGSNRCGEETLYLSELSNCHTFYPKSHAVDSYDNLVRSTQVPMITVEKFCNDFGNMDLLRMDVEGYEVEIIEGMLPCLQDPSFKMQLLFETHRSRYDEKEHDIKKPMRELFKAGYYVKYLVADSFLNGEGRKAYQKRGYGNEHCLVTFAVNVDRAVLQNISNDDALHFMCETDYVRAIMLDRK